MKTSSNAIPHTPRVDIIARVLWARKTASELLFRTGRSERTSRYWLSGKSETSAVARAAVIAEILAA